MLGAALVLLAWRRPRWVAWRGRRLLLAGCFGLVTALMNIAFYEAIARLPLGTAVTIEFCGPVAVAAFGSRSARDVAALVLAGARPAAPARRPASAATPRRTGSAGRTAGRRPLHRGTSSCHRTRTAPAWGH
jgi:hypothetical protein